MRVCACVLTRDCLNSRKLREKNWILLHTILLNLVHFAYKVLQRTRIIFKKNRLLGFLLLMDHRCEIGKVSFMSNDLVKIRNQGTDLVCWSVYLKTEDQTEGWDETVTKM